jgi:hypothetical protein
MGFQANFNAKQVAAQEAAAAQAAPLAKNTAEALQKLKAATPGVMTAADLVRQQTAAAIDPSQVSKADIVRALQNLSRHVKKTDEQLKEANAKIEKSAKRQALLEEMIDELSMGYMNQARTLAALLEKMRKIDDQEVFGEE